MKLTLPALLPSLAAWLAFAVPGAPAGPVSWTYQATAEPPGSPADAVYQVSYGQNPPGGLPGFASIDLYPTPATPEVGSATVTALSLTAGGWATGGMYGPIQGSYHVTLTLTDDASHASGSLVFAGEFGGTEGNGDLRSVWNRFEGATTKALTLGGNLYQVTIGPYQVLPPDLLPPGHTGIVPDGTISASVSVQPAAPAPEPSTLLLAAVGLSSMGLGAWRKWQCGTRALAAAS